MGLTDNLELFLATFEHVAEAYQCIWDTGAMQVAPLLMDDLLGWTYGQPNQVPPR